uniref:Uncharacterized protein n=1 Tax=Candidatus Kentrum sp. FW TaxID=2126338 RepID=A0A450U2M8_9GAMM|nr:MAG: hypothetical protein BECKFW1821C_GA0114237_11212 [Candidatus Kentron sp. FW]
MNSAIFGLIGVLLGAILTGAKDWWFQRSSIRKDRQFLSIFVAFALEKLGSECANVVFDDGLCEGQRDEQGRRVPQTSTPNFNPLSLDVN